MPGVRACYGYYHASCVQRRAAAHLVVHDVTRLVVIRRAHIARNEAERACRTLECLHRAVEMHAVAIKPRLDQRAVLLQLEIDLWRGE